MNRTLRLTLLWTAAVLCLLAAALGIAWIKLVPDDEQVAQRLVAQAEARLGVKVTVGSAHLDIWPRPQFVIDDIRTVQPQPIKIRRLVAHAALKPLLHGEVRLEDVLVDGAELPQLSLRGLRVTPAPAKKQADEVEILAFSFRDVTWITRHGVPLEFSGIASFAPGWQLLEAEIVRPGVKPATRMILTPLAADRWKVDLAVGGGTANGEVAIRKQADGLLALTGQLAPRNIDIAAGMAGFKRHSVLQGKGSGQTTLAASGKGIGELARSLHTSTVFTVASPTLLHIDVDKAIRTLGQDRTGQTSLLSLAGRMETQNGADGIVVKYSNLQAKGQTFSASGHGNVAKRQVNGELIVDVAGGLVGVPIKVSGALGQPQVSINLPAASTSTATGAAIGTAVLPGIGTAIGAGVGAVAGKLFGDDKDTKKKPPPVH